MVLFTYKCDGLVRADKGLASPKFQLSVVDPCDVFVNVIVLETHRGVSKAKFAKGLKCTSTVLSKESLQPLLEIATNEQVNVWSFTLLGLV